ncbi:hypothetical protein MNO14_03570 [Luteimonas sp. S4-F44]|uniref:hypothetical protein n=1 Tax=Luteimonas sp. S4-F44 TaxID=2925842 RepID=UPI001F53B85E|nr:hypothetical protein [Luteimonas sp. S4-F44]UNK43186.1 hypothetical protein MNO14_03570 [Luteimonas sp. S4-F44]
MGARRRSLSRRGVACLRTATCAAAWLGAGPARALQQCPAISDDAGLFVFLGGACLVLAVVVGSAVPWMTFRRLRGRRAAVVAFGMLLAIVAMLAIWVAGIWVWGAWAVMRC